VKVPEHIQEQIDAAKEIEATAMQLAQWLKYPVDAYGRVLDMNHLPDVVVTLVHHLTRGGWRWHPEKAVIKPRPVRGGGYYEDLVAYVDVNESDEPIVIDRNPLPAQEVWSVKPRLNVVDEPREE
jgi:hypothetical protein